MAEDRTDSDEAVQYEALRTAERTVRAFEKRIIAFHESLEDGEEMWVIAASGTEFFVEDIVETDGRMVVLTGEMASGERVELLCDYTQMEIMVIARPVQEDTVPRRAKISLGRD